MTNAQSKFVTTSLCSCRDFQHPWTEKCMNASAGLLLAAIPYCLRVYTMVYAFSLVMRSRVPRLQDLEHTVKGILQSTAFLVTNSYTFIMYNCLLRNLIGRYYLATVAFWPSFLSSWTAILVERPARRPLLALYVANVATETLWNMAEARGFVRSIPQGQTLIFGASVSILLYMYRLGLHKTTCKDSLFKILRIFVGKTEEGPLKVTEGAAARAGNAYRRSSRPPISFTSLSSLVQIYGYFVDALKSRHQACPHRESCLQYVVLGGLKPFVGGVTLQVALKLIMNIKNIAQKSMNWRNTIFNQKTLKLGVFLGSFSFLYKSASCLLRHCFDRDDARFAIPAGLIASIAFTQYPDVTVALYVMWKMLQIVYNLGTEKGVVPAVPGFTLLLYSFCTATLFHAGILEPHCLRPSYFKFLQQISGERFCKFNLDSFDVLGLDSARYAKEVIQRLNIVDNAELPKYSLASF